MTAAIEQPKKTRSLLAPGSVAFVSAGRFVCLIQINPLVTDIAIFELREAHMISNWKVYAFSLATLFAVAYVSCAVFDLLFPPYGMLKALGPISPWPIFGSPIGLVTGFVSFTIIGFVLGAIYGLAWAFWDKRLS